MSRLSYAQAYPGIPFRPRSSSWLARLIRMPAECVHLHKDSPWMATFLPDNLYLQGKNVKTREPQRPEVSLCRECLAGIFEQELASYAGRVVAFEPDPESVTQYFFVAAPDFEAAGVEPALREIIGSRLAHDDDDSKTCSQCSRPASWLWFSREAVPHLDATEQLQAAPGEHFCAEHGAKKVCSALVSLEHVNLYYVNTPYGEGGAYLWI